MKNPFARVLCFAFLLPLLVACPATVPPVPPGPEDAGTALPLDAGLTAPRCGDGALDTGETCDDGNLADGDGCSARCTRELGCAGARDLLTLAQSGPGETRIVAGARPAANSTLQASCGGAGAEQVYLFQAPFAGSLTASVQGGQGTTLSLRRTCAEALTETACAPAPRQVRAELVAGEALAFVIDGPEAGGPFTVQVQFLRARAAGEACDPARQLDVCAAGLRCDGRCVDNHAPVLSSASALRTGREGQHLFIQLDGTDADADVEVLGLAALDAAGAPVPWADPAATGTPLSEGLLALDTPVAGATAFSRTLTWRGFFTSFPAVATVELWLQDSGGLRSQRRSVAVTAAPVRVAGAACDSAGLADLCPTGHRCAGSPAACVPGTAPALGQTAFLRLPGNVKRLLLEGTDPELDLSSVTLEPLTAAGQPRPVDLDGDGDVEPSASLLVSQGPTAAFVLDFDASALPSDVEQLALMVHDGSGLQSPRRVLTLVDQPVVAAGGTCDARWKFDRCASPLACAGQPARCVSANAPTLSRAAYLRVGTGAYLYLEGSDAQKDLAALSLEFLDVHEDPVPALDTDGDLLGDATTATVPMDTTRFDLSGAFFMRVDVSAVMGGAAKLALVLRDRAGLATPRQVLTLALRELRQTGQTCDPNGFDVCANGLLCAPPAGPGALTCRAQDSLRLDVCAASAEVTPGAPAVSGQFQGASLWEPPPSCLDPVWGGGAEVVFRLHLAAAAPTLRLSTANAGTDVDTVVYLLPGCGELGGAGALTCADDVAGDLRASVELSNVPAGDYLVVVDSVASSGGSYVLTVATP
jgi:cysteine-rich repeat protein